MRILVLATDIFWRGGIARYTATLASSLAGMLRPADVDVLCFFDWGYAGVRPSEFGLIGVVSSDARAGASSRLHFMCKAARAGMQGYDLVIANHVALAPVAALMKLAFGTPYWVACHSVEIWWGTSPVRHAALKRADLILPVSRYTADVVQKMAGIQQAQVMVVYNAVPNSFASLLAPHQEMSAFIPSWKKAKRVLLSVCNLVRGNEFKGIDTVIRSLPGVLASVPELQYVVVGEGEIRGKLEGLAVETGVADKVTFVGEVPDAELAELYRGCDVFVLPSRGQQTMGTVGGEGFGRVYVEAALAAKPVVGSRSGGAAEAVLHGRTGLLVDPDSSDGVGHALLAILQDPQLAARMGSEGRKWALATFSEDALSSSLRELLRPYGFKNEAAKTLVPAGGQL